jgi:hypothetical protein
MALTKIVTGMEKGPEAIDANFTELAGTTDWSTSGISYLNGATGGDGDLIRYRYTQMGSRKLYEITGYLGVSLKPSQKLDVFKIPTNIAQAMVSYQGRVTPTADAGNMVRVDVDSTSGTVTMSASSLNSETDMGGFFIDIWVIV